LLLEWAEEKTVTRKKEGKESRRKTERERERE
jgi:hypothetical protein